MNAQVSNKKNVCKTLYPILSSTFVFYVKTLNFHWNITGEKFQPLHKEFEDQYLNLAGAIDEIAERIRSLGYKVPARTQDFIKNSSIIEQKGDIVQDSMLKSMVDDHALLSHQIVEAMEKIKHYKDEVTLDLLMLRKTYHDKICWMLKSFIDTGEELLKID